jgi:flagellum-specific peptidoglycan hydrolase FlgJ
LIPLAARLDEIARIAVATESATRLPARLMIAQWAVESAWGTKPVGHANYFGLKRAARHTRFYDAATEEFVNGCPVGMTCEFADYDDLAESAADYAWLITHGAPYDKAWTRFLADDDVDALVAGVARVYATSPDYMRLVGEIASQSNVERAIEMVKNGPRL